MMKRKIKCGVILMILIFLSYLPGYPDSIKDLSKRHREWLEKEVAYIITPLEKEVFMELESDRERDLFIETLWK